MKGVSERSRVLGPGRVLRWGKTKACLGVEYEMTPFACALVDFSTGVRRVRSQPEKEMQQQLSATKLVIRTFKEQGWRIISSNAFTYCCCYEKMHRSKFLTRGLGVGKVWWELWDTNFIVSLGFVLFLAVPPSEHPSASKRCDRLQENWQQCVDSLFVGGLEKTHAMFRITGLARNQCWVLLAGVCTGHGQPGVRWPRMLSQILLFSVSSYGMVAMGEISVLAAFLASWAVFNQGASLHQHIGGQSASGNVCVCMSGSLGRDCWQQCLPETAPL